MHDEQYEKHLADIWREWGRPPAGTLKPRKLREAHKRASDAVRTGQIINRDLRPKAREFIEAVLSAKESSVVRLNLSIFGGIFSTLVSTWIGGPLMKLLDQFVNLFPAALRDYVPTVLAAVVILVNTALQAFGLGVDVMTFIEVAAPSGLFAQIMTARQRLWDRGGSSPGQRTSKTKVMAGGALVVIGAAVAVTVFFPAFTPLAVQLATVALGALGLGAGAAMTAGAKKTGPKKVK